MSHGELGLELGSRCDGSQSVLCIKSLLNWSQYVCWHPFSLTPSPSPCKIKARREAAKKAEGIFWRVPCALRDDTLFDSGDGDAAGAGGRGRSVRPLCATKLTNSHSSLPSSAANHPRARTGGRRGVSFHDVGTEGVRGEKQETK